MVLVLLGVIHVASENTVCIPNTSSVLGIHKSVLLYTLCIALKFRIIFTPIDIVVSIQFYLVP